MDITKELLQGYRSKKPDGHAARQFVHKAYESYSVRDGDENDYSE